MTLNYIWIAFFLIAFVIALFKFVFLGDVEIFARLVTSTFDTSKVAFELALYLTGILALWLGLLRIGEKGGIVNILNKLVGPFFKKLFPEVPANHPAIAPMIMNIACNMLNLDNAATPLGLKAMEELQHLNPKKDTASNAQIMFLVLNASGLTIIPINIMVYRAQLGAANPADVFIPILIATFFSTMAGLIAVAIYQRINLFNKTILLYVGTLTLFIASVIWYFSMLDDERIKIISTSVSNLILFTIMVFFIALGLIRRINVYEAFVDGAKEGFSVAIRIIPYLIAMLVAIAVFRECGALTMVVQSFKWFFSHLNIDTSFTDALPTAFMKPLSGSGARGMMIDTMTTFGADSFAGRLASVMQGSTETTFYVIAVYFGAVSIRHTRHTVACALVADLVGVIAAIMICYLFFPIV